MSWPDLNANGTYIPADPDPSLVVSDPDQLAACGVPAEIVDRVREYQADPRPINQYVTVRQSKGPPPVPAEREPSRRLAVLTIPFRPLESRLRFPPGTRIDSLYVNEWDRCFRLRLEHESFAQVEDGMPFPEVRIRDGRFEAAPSHVMPNPFASPYLKTEPAADEPLTVEGTK